LTAGVTIPDALVLTAGLGTRLRPLTSVRAKPAVPVGGEPLIRRIVGWLAGYGVRRVTLNLHHLPATIAGATGDGSDLHAEVRFSWEQPLVLGSAGGVRQALDIVGAETFLVINGDTLTNFDLRELAGAHAATDALVTLALVPNVDSARYGGVRLNADGTVAGFVPRGPEARGTFHFIGAQAVCRPVFAGLPAGVPVNTIGGCYDALIGSEPGRVRGFVTSAAFWDIGTVADYWRTHWAFSGNGHDTSRSASVSPSATVDRTIVWDGVTVDRDATLRECIVTDGVHVTAGAHYERAILIRARDGSTIAEPLPLE
jgi:NDP-sugar pyrophosphorylase family protein